MIDIIFGYGVEIMRFLSLHSGLSYKEINALIFLVLQPALVMGSFLLWRLEKRKNKSENISKAIGRNFIDRFKSGTAIKIDGEPSDNSYKGRQVIAKFFKYALIVFLLLAGVGLLISPILYIFKEPIVATYNKTRPLFLDGGGEGCIAALNSMKVSYKRLGNIGTEECPVLNAVRVSNFQNTKISSPVILSCPTASAVATWLDEIKASTINHMGTLNCRKQRSSNIYSEHSFGTAIDISHIDNASVKNDWGKSSENGKALKIATASACKHFNNVLTPDTNALHGDHYHLDTGPGLGCSFGRVSRGFFRVVKIAQSYIN